MLPLLQDQNLFERIPLALWFWIAFLIVPVLGKILGWIVERASPGDEERRDARERMRERRDEARQRMEELARGGERAWDELLEGRAASVEELAEPEHVPVPAAPEPPPEPASRTIERESLPSAAPPADAPRPIPEDELEDRGAHPRGRSLDVLRRRRTSARPAAVAATAATWPHTGAEWRRAIVLSEVLGPPLALRDGHQHGLPPGLAS